MAKKVEKWEYAGRLYNTEEEADYAENVDELMDYLDNHPLHVSQKGIVKAQEILLWLKMSCPRVFIKLLPKEPECNHRFEFDTPGDTEKHCIYCNTPMHGGNAPQGFDD